MVDSKMLGPLAAICCALPMVILTTLLFTVVPIYFLVIGIIKIDGCPAEWRLPVWMITIAVFMILERVLLWVLGWSDRKYESLNEKPSKDLEEGAAVERWNSAKFAQRPKAVTGLLAVSRASIGILTLIGIYLAFSVNFEQASCDGWLYYPAYYFCLFFFLVILVTLVFGCCFACMAAVTSAKS